jgi:putative membrane protein
MCGKDRSQIKRANPSFGDGNTFRNRALDRNQPEATMKQYILAAALAVMLAAPVYAQSMGEKSGVNSTLGIAPKTQDFVKEVAISDMFEIESSKLAQTKANGPSKTFAEHMIQDHTKTSSELKSKVAGKMELPTALDSSHQSKLDKLKSLNGENFTKQYNSDQVSAHKDAVNLFDRYSKGGDNADLKAWAATTLPTLQTHLKMAQELN